MIHLKTSRYFYSTIDVEGVTSLMSDLTLVKGTFERLPLRVSAIQDLHTLFAVCAFDLVIQVRRLPSKPSFATQTPMPVGPDLRGPQQRSSSDSPQHRPWTLPKLLSGQIDWGPLLCGVWS